MPDSNATPAITESRQSDFPHSLPGPVIGEMRRCRDAAVRAASSVKSHGVIYHALQMVVVAIDGAAQVITGQPYYFSEGGTGPSESERARSERQAAFERGEEEL
ncbi:MAG TPA: hypothetical protein VIF02_05845 [Methylocella sp.]